MSKITNTGVFIPEGSAAATDVAGSSQIWTKSDTPSSLYHTDDAGNDHRLGTTVSGEFATTSGTTVDLTGIPVGVTRVDVMFEGVSSNGTGEYMLRIGPSGGVVTSGYQSGSTNGANADEDTTSFKLTYGPTAATGMHGMIQMRLKDVANNTWVSMGLLSKRTGANLLMVSSGSCSLAASLNKMQLLNTAGNTWDAGSIALSWS